MVIKLNLQFTLIFVKMMITHGNAIFMKLLQKVNSRWPHSLEEVEFHIILDENLIFSDIQPTPVASSF